MPGSWDICGGTVGGWTGGGMSGTQRHTQEDKQRGGAPLWSGRLEEPAGDMPEPQY